MKTLLFVLFVGIVSCTEYRFPVDKTVAACKLLQITAEIELQEHDSMGKISKVAFIDLDKEVVKVVETACSKDNDTTTNFDLDINDGQAGWKFLFSKGADNMLKLSSTFTFIPNDFFQNNDNASVKVAIPSQPLTKYNRSFTCNANTSSTLNASKEVNETFTYSIVLTVTDFKVQVYNLVNGTFTAGDECAADESTTGAMTTQPMTTPPPVITNQFELKDDDNETCIILKLHDEIHIEYELIDKKMVMAKPYSIPKEAEVTGNCAGNTTKSNLVLSFFGDTMEFVFSDTDSHSKLEMIHYNVMLDKKRFPNATNQGSTLKLNGTDANIESADDTYFRCDAGETIMFVGGKSKLVISLLQVQAFNVNETFTGNGVECDADKTTTQMSTSPMTSPGTTAVPEPTVNNFTIPGEHCILIRTALQLKIPYVAKKENKTAIIDVPPVFTVSGDCNVTALSQMININFFTSWNITLIFTEKSSSIEATTDTHGEYSLQNVTMEYTEDAVHFPDVKTPGVKKTVHVSNLDDFKVMADQKSYKCKAHTDIKFDGGVVLTTMQFQYRAFSKINETSDFANDGVNECAADSNSNSVVPIAVGAALAGLVVIVLIAYLIGRRRSKRSGYESV